jgi:hypothetical protein
MHWVTKLWLPLAMSALVGHSVAVQTQSAIESLPDETESRASVTETPWANGKLQIAARKRFLQHKNGKHFLYLADTPWSIFERLTREDARMYLKDSARKGFTVVQAVALWQMSRSGNAYGDSPLGLTDGKYNPDEIITTPGNDPSDALAYDYWDHVDYVLDEAEENGLYVALLPTWGNYVSGTTSYAFNMSSNIFTARTARSYGEFLGRRYGHRPNIIWVLGGDRSAVYPNGDFRAIWRSMAEGIGRGVTGEPLQWNQADPAWDQLLMTYHPRRVDDPGSSLWFHNDPWLDFNGIETESWEVATKVDTDWNISPRKPTALLEGRYEAESTNPSALTDPAFEQRYQLYHAMFAGSLGYAYGHRRIWRLSGGSEPWQEALNEPGRRSMTHLPTLLDGIPDAQLLRRVPDQTLLEGPTGTARNEDLVLAMRGDDGEFALAYSTNGRNIAVNLAKLATGTADAFWFNPRTGKFADSGGGVLSGAFREVSTGVGASVTVFDPPGRPRVGNDWVLKLAVRDPSPPPPPPAGPDPSDIVLWATSASIVGDEWTLVEDQTAAGGMRLQERNDGAAKVVVPLAEPAAFVEFTFFAQAGTGYRLWMRGRGPDYASDSVSVQFSGSTASSGDPVYRIGSSDATFYSVEGCDYCGRSGWGWQDNGWDGSGSLIYFAESGPQTLRLQRRQDGIAIDQIVLSPRRYLSSPPGSAKEDRTILPATQK